MDKLKDKEGWKGWKWMFVMEEIKDVVIGVVIMIYIEN